jgi:DNA polymerase-3 subunit alpha
MDFSNRDILVDPDTGWLKRRFGDHYAQIGIDTSLKLRSSVKDVARVLHGGVPGDIERLAKLFEDTPQGIEDLEFIFGYEGSDKSWVRGSIETDAALMEYVQKYPDEWAIVQKVIGLSRSKSRHPCGYCVCDAPVSDFIPMTIVSDVPVTAYTPKSVEASGGLKMDFLSVTSLLDLKSAIRLIQSRREDSLRRELADIEDELSFLSS